SACAVLGFSLVTGYVVARFSAPVIHNRYFPWIMGRTLGLGAYAALVTLVVLGIWVRHPWRQRRPVLHPETRLRLHASLGASVVVLVIAHVVALASDRYAGVGWKGALVPDAASYRPQPVTLGVLAAYGLVTVTVTAALGGRLVVGRHWLAVHRLAAPTFLLVWFHGVLAGSDTTRLRVVYAVSGGVVALLGLSRLTARPRRPEAASPPPPASRSDLQGATMRPRLVGRR
ncbi:MAG: hypothetical protein ACYDEN_12580, partial [Acidimicrobiales bacterium]